MPWFCREDGLLQYQVMGAQKNYVPEIPETSCRACFLVPPEWNERFDDVFTAQDTNVDVGMPNDDQSTCDTEFGGTAYTHLS